MEVQRRSTGRVLSSLRDLKLKGVRGAREGETEQTAKRTQSKKFVIRGDNLEDDIFYENFSKIDRKKTKLDLQFIEKCLSKHFVFRQLVEDSGIMADLLSKFFCCEVAKNDFIMNQGDDASSFFVLEKGKISVIINGQQRREIQPGEGFGELALLYNAPRSASLFAMEKSTLWGIDRNTFRKAVAEVCEKEYTQNRSFIDKVRFFEYLTQKQKDFVASVLIQHVYHNGEKIVIQGDQASSFYIIKDGTVQVFENGTKVATLTNGMYFGQAALVSSTQKRNATVQADGQCTLLALGRDSLKGILGEELHVIVYRNKISFSIAKSPIFCQLDTLRLEQFIDNLQIEKIKKGLKIVTAGMKCRSKIFYILQGTLQKTSSSIQIEADGQVFYGQRSLQNAHAEATYATDMKFQNEGVIAYINYDKVTQSFGCTFEEMIVKEKRLSIAMAKHMQQSKTFKQKATKIKLEELSILKKLGCGQFGVVYLANHKGNFYALKCIEKSQIIECKLQHQLRDEKQVLQLSNHPFILQYGRSFKDDRFVYFLTEFINGLELFDAIRQIGLLNPKDTKFYIGSMILALQYLHSAQIIYRDLKPQNLIVNSNGYLKLIDMGTCKLLRGNHSAARTFTIIGTPQYMAPEVLAGKGYSYNVDLWSLGVCFYEFMCGYVPFGADFDDPYEIYEEVLNKELKFPTFVTDEKAKNLMLQLLSKKQEIRLGGNFSILKSHPWFNLFQWDALIIEKMTPPYKIPANKLTSLKAMLTMKGKSVKSELDSSIPPKKNPKPIHKNYDEHWDIVF